jgi:hypothetical protein
MLPVLLSPYYPIGPFTTSWPAKLEWRPIPLNYNLFTLTCIIHSIYFNFTAKIRTINHISKQLYKKFCFFTKVFSWMSFCQTPISNIMIFEQVHQTTLNTQKQVYMQQILSSE